MLRECGRTKENSNWKFSCLKNVPGCSDVKPDRLAKRNYAVGNGERDRPGRSVRRLAEQMARQIPLTEWCDKRVSIVLKRV